MGLRLKNAITVTGVFLAIISATYLLYTHVLLRDFDLIERERANLNIQRVFQSVDAVRDDLHSRTIDWARWDETYTFMQGRNKAYLSTNVNYEAVAPFELVHIIFIAKDLSLVSGLEAQHDTESLRPLRAQTLQSIMSNAAISSYLRSSPEEPLSGLLRLGDSPLFISICPITDNQGTEPKNGFLIFTRAFSPQLQQQIEKRTQLALSFSAVVGESAGPLLSTTLPVTDRSVSTGGDEVVSVGGLRDITNTPIISFSHTAPRTIYQQGKASRNYVVSLMAICLIFANFVLIVFLNQAVIGRLERFAASMKTISSTTDFSLRIAPDGRDEIGYLTETFNRLLQTTEDTTSQLAHARDAAIQATLAKSNFVAHVSHELRSPIHGLTGLLRILFKAEGSPTKRAYIQMAQDSASTLLSTINNILDLSKIESGSVDLQHIPFSLRQVLRTSARTIAPRVDEKTSLHFLIDVEPGVPDEVIGDPLRLQQILVNLLGNAVKFTSEGSISLRVAPKGLTATTTTLSFEVTDTGIGMSEEQLGRVFKPYLQADVSIQTKYESTGLGLSIVTSLMHEVGGELSVRSMPQQGTTFTLSIPFRLQEVSVETPAEIRGRCILIDDPGPFASWISNGLTRYGCVVERVSPSDEAAVRRISRSHPTPALVVLSPRAVETPATIENLRYLRASLTCPIIASLKTSHMAAHEQMRMFGDIIIAEAPTSPEEIIRALHGRANKVTTQSTSDNLKLHGAAYGCRILVADDAPTSRLIIREMLEEAGYEVETVENGEDLARRIRCDIEGTSDTPISLVLTDIEMPIMGGLEATQEIRALEATRPKHQRLPIIAITAHALAEEQRSFHEGGIDYVITKPLKPGDLNEALMRMTHPSFSPSPAGSPTLEPQTLCGVLCELTTRLWTEVSNSPTDSKTSRLSQGIDIADVFERSGESPRRTKLILSAFLDSYQAPLQTLKKAAKPTNIKEVTVAAHSLKGLLLDVGASHTAERAATIEQLLKSGDFESAAASCEALTVETIQVVSLVERVVRHFPSLG